MAPILEIEQLTKKYTIGDRSFNVLDDVSLQINTGEFVAIVGSSGSGKSTLLSLMSGLDSPTSGRICLNKVEITHLSEDALADIRNQVMGFVFQSFHLVPSLTALENVMLPAELGGSSQAQADAENLLARLSLIERADNFPHQLSGGEKQRVAMARALINEPKIILADEPTGNLDSKNGWIILQLLLELQKESNTTLVMVTHDAEIAASADRIIHLQDGKVVDTQAQVTAP